MTEETKTNDVLVPLHKATETMAPAVKAVTVRWDVSYHDCTTINKFKCSQLALQPLYLIARVIPVLE